MKYDPKVHHRHSIRLPGYSYSSAAAYFVTVCTHARELTLQNPDTANAIREAWETLPRRFSDVSLDEFVIMPNHFHGIIVIQTPGVVQGAASSAPTLGRVMRAFKSVSAIEANRILYRSERPFWQRNYYERIVRNEDELNRMRQYIQDNPFRWAEDPDHPDNVRTVPES